MLGGLYFATVAIIVHREIVSSLPVCYFLEKQLPLMITNAVTDKPLPVCREGLNIRDCLNVEDHCRATDLIVRNECIDEAYNVGDYNEVQKSML